MYVSIDYNFDLSTLFYRSLNAIGKVYMPHNLYGEFLGTLILIIFGGGVVANVVLNKTKGENSGWIVITTGWFVAVCLGVFVARAAGAEGADPPAPGDPLGGDRGFRRVRVPARREAHGAQRAAARPLRRGA